MDIRLSRIPQKGDTYSTALVANIPIKKVKNWDRTKVRDCARNLFFIVYIILSGSHFLFHN